VSAVVSSDIHSTWITWFEGCECNLFIHTDGVICPTLHAPNPKWTIMLTMLSLFFWEAYPAWMALPMKVNPHHNEQTSSVNPSTLQDISSRDGRQTPTVSYGCTWLALYVGWQWTDKTVPCRSAATFHGLAVNRRHGTMLKCCNISWAGSEWTTQYHVKVLQHFTGWQWTDNTVPCRSAATFHALAVNGRHGTMSTCCKISRAGSEWTTWYHVDVLQNFTRWQWTDDTVPCRSVATFHVLAVNGRHGTMLKCSNISCAGSEWTTWYHVEVLQHFMCWQWTDDMVPCRSAATFHGLAVNGRHGTMSKCCNISFSVSSLQTMP